jgi:hypothetical protein
VSKVPGCKHPQEYRVIVWKYVESLGRDVVVSAHCGLCDTPMRKTAPTRGHVGPRRTRRK